MAVLIGTQFFNGDASANHRQDQARASLTSLRGAQAVNVQWTDDVCERPGIETVPRLTLDAVGVSGLPGRRKPILSELFDVLADTAAGRGCRWFAFVNADIVVTQAAVDTIEREGRQTYGISRMDVDAGTGADLGLIPDGIDLFAFDVAWWREHRGRFRPYVLAEWFYDNIYTAIMMAHSDGLVLNREGEIRHERHPHALHASPHAVYNGYLAALDSLYFTLWAEYRAELDAMRKRGSSEAEERALVRAAFVYQPSPAARLKHVGRCVKASFDFRAKRRALLAQR